MYWGESAFRPEADGAPMGGHGLVERAAPAGVQAGSGSPAALAGAAEACASTAEKGASGGMTRAVSLGPACCVPPAASPPKSEVGKCGTHNGPRRDRG